MFVFLKRITFLHLYYIESCNLKPQFVDYQAFIFLIINMKRQNHLFDLIHSLTKSELYFFKQFMQSIEQKGQHYLKVVEAILKQKNYDEKAIKKQLSNENFVAHFPVFKNQLFNTILKALRLFYEETTVMDKILALETNYRILKNRGLMHIASVQLDKAIKLANESEALVNKIRLGQWHNNRLSNIEIYRDDKNANNSFVDVPALCDDLKYYFQFESLVKKIDKLILKSSVRKKEDLEQIKQIANSSLLATNSEILSVRTQVFYFHAKASCFLGLKNYPLFVESYKNLYKLFSEHPRILDTEPFTKIITYRNLIWGLVRTKKDFSVIQFYINEYTNFLNQFKGKQKSALQYERRILDCEFAYRINFYLFNKEYARALKYAKDFNELLDLKRKKISDFHFINYKYEIAYTYWCNNLKTKAQTILSELLNRENLKIRNDIFAFTNLLNLLIEYENKHFEFLKYQLTNVKLKLQRRNYFFDFEKTLIEMLNKLLKEVDIKAEKEILKNYKKTFIEMSEQPTEIEALERLNIFNWLDQQIEVGHRLNSNG